MACRAKHQWMAFIDVDEFLVIRNSTVTSLPQLLREYTDFGGLAVNWQVILDIKPLCFRTPAGPAVEDPTFKCCVRGRAPVVSLSPPHVKAMQASEALHCVATCP